MAHWSLNRQMFRLLVLAMIVVALGRTVAAEDLDVKVGPQQILIAAGSQGLTHFPDQPLGILKKSPLTFLASVGNETVLFTGQNWRTLRPLATVLKVGEKGAFDSGYAGVGGVYQDGATTYAFYHAEFQENLRSEYSAKNGQLPFIGSVGLAVSTDGCRSFQKLGQVLTSKHPRQANAECAGLGDVTICRDKTGEFLLAYYTDYSRHANQGVQTAVARAPIKDKGRPGTWSKFSKGSFSEPGIGGEETHVLSGHSRGADAYSPCVVFVRELDRYLMVFCAVVYSEVQAGNEETQPRKSGIYLTSSTDGLQWAEPTQLVACHALLRTGLQCAVHPTLSIESANKSQVRAQLLYAFTEEWPKTPHHLAGRTVTIAKKKSTPGP